MRLLLGFVSAAVFTCAGAPLTLNAVDSGFYFANGTHNPVSQNYLTGQFGTEHRGFFVFDLSGITGTITSATLRLYNPDVSAFLHGYVSNDPAETLTFYDVSTPVADLTGNLAGVAGFDDLGSGALYGTRIVSAADNATVIEITLNSAALANLNAAGGLFALGSSLSTISGTTDQYVFGFSMTGLDTVQTRELVLDVGDVPEPSTAALAVAALVLIAMSLGKKRRRV